MRRLRRLHKVAEAVAGVRASSSGFGSGSGAAVSAAAPAAILARARARPGAPERAKIGHLPEALQALVVDERGAYAVQDELHELLQRHRPELGGIAGTKVGCTTKVMQEFLGMPHPCAGAIWSSTVAIADGTFSGLWRPGVECEIAVRLCRDVVRLPVGSAHTRDSVSAAVGEVMAAIEIVDDRYVDFGQREPGAMVWVADDFFGAGVCLAEGVGADAWREIDLAAVVGEMKINGESVGRGVGADIILGHPFEALVWLANKRAELDPDGDVGTPLLEAGQIVMLGSVVQTKWVQPGDVVEVSVQGLGTATARFA